ncbi:hypothetical protein B0T25DRAFT_574452 [Lasiosphaeria hispida]|uniref:Uncharacterized protein n=1 Tax=Lasiosphaeria hispida TaxID=260671 RepID=A0AAJ0M8U0_9PEZI|nr:hypothetical protein B0T25DRAFT_574452 [Lasiosphaeria hispida]
MTSRPPRAECSLNYQGNPTLALNQSTDVLEEKNCSLWITNLPPDITYNELLGNIANVERVWATHIVPPEPQRGNRGSAAEVNFFTNARLREYLSGGPDDPRLEGQGDQEQDEGVGGPDDTAEPLACGDLQRSQGRGQLALSDGILPSPFLVQD